MTKHRGLHKAICLSLLTLTVFLINPVHTSGQLSYGGKPALHPETKTPVPFIELPSFGKDLFLAEIARENSWLKQFTLAKDFPVRVHPGNSGNWSQSPGGEMIWRIGFFSPGASSMAISFDHFDIPEDARVFIYGPGTVDWLGAFTRMSSYPEKKLITAPVPGDRVIVEYILPRHRVKEGRLQIGMVSHGFAGPDSYRSIADSLAGISGSCNVDINCAQGDAWQDEKRAVCRILVHKFLVNKGDTTFWAEICSGVMVNNAKNDGKPYLLTANHCIKNSYEAENSLYFFGYESPRCDGPDGWNHKSLSGSRLLATSTKIDFTLVELNQVPPFYYYPLYAGWNRSNTPPSRTVCIHHPQGDVKKISLDDHPPLTSSYGGFDPNSCWLIQRWETGTTEIGSSGSPLFDQNHRVIGLLSGGIATCLNPVSDYFTRISSAWQNYPLAANQLKAWLDPDNLNPLSINSLDPYSVSTQTCDTLMNFLDTEQFTTYPYGGAGDGTWSGHNTGRYTQYAEKIVNNDTNFLTGAFLYVAKAQSNAPADRITLKMWNGTATPEVVVTSKNIPLVNFTETAWNFIEFDSLVIITEDFWIGFEIYYDQPSGPPTDEFSLFTVEDRGIPGTGTVYIYKDGLWTGLREIHPQELVSSLGIRVSLCSEVDPLQLPDQPGDPSNKNTYLIYPNPTAGHFTLEVLRSQPVNLTIRIFNASGHITHTAFLREVTGTVQISPPGIRSGLYLVHISDGQRISVLKLSVIK